MSEAGAGGEDITVVRVAEAEIGADLSGRLQSLLRASFPGYPDRSYFKLPPHFRYVAMTAGGDVAAQMGVEFRIIRVGGTVLRTNRGRAVLPARGRGVRVRLPALARGLPGAAGVLGAQPDLAAVAPGGHLRPDAAGLPRLPHRGRCRSGGGSRYHSAQDGLGEPGPADPTPITPETERVLPAAELPGLRARMNDALLELVYDDPLAAWGDLPVLELSGPLDRRLDTVLAVVART